MMISNYLANILFVITVMVGPLLVFTLREKELCPCIIKVPVAMLCGFIAIVYNIEGNVELSRMMLFFFPLMLAGALVGNLGDKITYGNLSGQIIHVLIFLGFPFLIAITYGIPNLIVFASVAGGVFLFFLLGSIFKFKSSIKESWYEYIYLLILAIAFAFTIQEDIYTFLKIGIGCVVFSEFLLHTSRTGKNMNDVVAYDAARIYIIGLAIMLVPSSF